MKLNEDNFLKVLKENQGIILKIVNSYCKKIEDRGDLIQEITIQLWKSWKNYNSDYKISTWMYRIALNVAITFYRKTS
ncbi:sigma-70 family RNA polymerase sigma factor [Aquimarina sp. 2201CG5-10]|uniref:sigma-70 family RNA polymerase sigma factor n=1 Tax=Aquimarina callyspongiae TaxID=3098150 RepID=UPI002AB56E6F|nr:sigma-70 family RNA polymerase sigma factor [Aquimarina sp. 2201CG5-10]MDY8134324.1 sigma-70 family RNA polymerase sigma factor [Aquimarina sp. 2201CG5-10]